MITPGRCPCPRCLACSCGQPENTCVNSVEAGRCKCPDPGWEDRTGYARGEKGKIEPRTWGFGPLVVTRHLSFEPDRWGWELRRMTGHPMRLEARELGAAIDEATEKAHVFLACLKGNLPPRQDPTGSG